MKTITDPLEAYKSDDIGVTILDEFCEYPKLRKDIWDFLDANPDKEIAIDRDNGRAVIVKLEEVDEPKSHQKGK